MVGIDCCLGKKFTAQRNYQQKNNSSLNHRLICPIREMIIDKVIRGGLCISSRVRRLAVNVESVSSVQAGVRQGHGQCRQIEWVWEWWSINLVTASKKLKSSPVDIQGENYNIILDECIKVNWIIGALRSRSLKTTKKSCFFKNNYKLIRHTHTFCIYIYIKKIDGKVQKKTLCSALLNFRISLD